MAFQTAVLCANAMLDAFETYLGASPVLRIYSGDPPATPETAFSGTLLAGGTLPSDFMANAATRAKLLAGTWTLTGVAAGYAGYFRILNNAASVVAAQGLVSQPWAISTAYAVTQRVHNGGNVYRCTTAGTSAGSGGPTGTGTGITDGGAVWNYVGTQDMTLDNTNIAVSQAVNVSAFTLNGANA